MGRKQTFMACWDLQPQQGKCSGEKMDWVGQVSYVLFVLRKMPHSDSGFSPFDLVYGFRVRTPLDALYHGSIEVDSEKLNVCEWVSNMAKRLELMRDCAAVKMMKGKESRLIDESRDEAEGV